MRYQEASAGKRIGAYLLDVLFIFLVSMLLSVIFLQKEMSQLTNLYTELANGVLSEEDFILRFTTIYQSITGKAFILSLGIAFFYYVVLAYLMDGATLGKKIVGIKIVREGSDRIGFGSLLLRDLIMKYLLNSLTCGILNLISFIKILVSNDKRAIHDMAATTRVVDVKKKLDEEIYDL